MARNDQEDSGAEEVTGQGKGGPSQKQMMVVIGILALIAVGAFVVPKIIRPQVTLPLPTTSPDLKKALESIATPSNVNLAVGLAGQVLSNVVRGQTTTVIISNQAPPAITPIPSIPSGTPIAPPSLGGVLLPSPVPPSNRGAGPVLDLYIMGKKGALPAASDAPVASLLDNRELFRAARFKDNPAYLQYQNNNLWLRWRGRLSVPINGTHTLFHSINMDRLPNNGPKRATDFNARGRQKVYSNIYVDGQKLDSKEKRFSEIESSFRTSFNASLSAGFHDVDVWLGVESEDVPFVFDEISMTLEARYANQNVPTRLQASDLAR